MNHLTDLANNIKERKELREKIKKFLNDRGIPITKKIRSALPNILSRGNSIELRTHLKENLEGYEFIQMQFLSMMNSHINNETLSELLNSSNIFSGNPDLMNEVSNILQDEMSPQAERVANDIFSAASKARSRYLASKTNPAYGSSTQNLRIEADKEAFNAASTKLIEKLSKISCGSKFTALSRSLAISLDKAIEMNKIKSGSIGKNDIDQLKEKIIESLLLSTFTKVLTEEIKNKSRIFSGSIPFEALVLPLENSIHGRKNLFSIKDHQPQITITKKLKSEEVEKFLINMSDKLQFPESFNKLKESLKTGGYSKFWPSRNI